VGPDVETERLLLRRWRPDDLDELAAVFAQEPVWRYPFQRGFTRAETKAFLDRKIDEWRDRGFSQWAVEVKEAELQAAGLPGAGRLIGFLGLAPPEFLPEVMPTVEVGWRLDPAWWGRGLATEGGRAGPRSTTRSTPSASTRSSASPSPRTSPRAGSWSDSA
jgi:RimJ/RimL family protein N-acetyltransferase